MSLSANDKPNDNVRIPLYFILAFLVVFVVNGIFVYLAVSTNHGVVTENAYEKGLQYDHIVEEVRRLKQEEFRGTGAP